MSGYQFLKLAYFEGEYIPFESAKMSVATHALHYGTSAFGGLRGVVDPVSSKKIHLFRLDRHAHRLSQSARLLQMDLAAETIRDTIVEFVRRNAPTESFYIRPLVYTSDLGIAPRLHNIKKDFLVYGLVLGDYLPPTGVTCRISSWYRQEDRSLPLRGKIGGAYITSSLAKTEAVASGFDEAILMNTQGKVCEASGMNLFIVRRGKLVTPGVEQDILEGITRDSIIELASELGIPVEERPIDKSELFIAEEAFLSGTAARITPIRKIENYELSDTRPITTMLREKLVAISEGRDKARSEWVRTVEV